MRYIKYLNCEQKDKIGTDFCKSEKIKRVALPTELQDLAEAIIVQLHYHWISQEVFSTF